MLGTKKDKITTMYIVLKIVVFEMFGIQNNFGITIKQY